VTIGDTGGDFDCIRQSMVSHDQLRGAYRTHDDANACRTSTDTNGRSPSVSPCQMPY
jgi:hypothetical protein